MTTAIEYLSWSKVQTYRQCPRQFSYRYIEQAPAERKASSLIFGGAFHRAVERLHVARLEGSILPITESLLGVFEDAWKEESANGVPVQYPKTETYQSQKELACRMLDAYRRFVLTERRNGEVIAIEDEGFFALAEGLPPFITRLDLLEKFGDELHITDLKTAKRPYDEAKIREIQLQLVAYGHSAMPAVRALGIKKVVPKIELVTKTKTPKILVIAPPTSQADVERLKATVCEVWSAIEKGVFLRHESWQCRGCPFMERCRRET